MSPVAFDTELGYVSARALSDPSIHHGYELPTRSLETANVRTKKPPRRICRSRSRGPRRIDVQFGFIGNTSSKAARLEVPSRGSGAVRVGPSAMPAPVGSCTVSRIANPAIVCSSCFKQYIVRGYRMSERHVDGFWRSS